MAEITRDQTDRQIEVPASVQREGDAAAAMIAEVLATVRSHTSTRGGERTENPLTPAAPIGLGYPTDVLNSPVDAARAILPPVEINLSMETRVRAPEARDQTNVRITYDSSGQPRTIRDHMGTWNRSADGSWRIGDPLDDNYGGPYHVFRGDRWIDENSNYVTDSRDYGVRTTMSPSGLTTREMRTSGGVRYSVTVGSDGQPTEFSDPAGEWRRENGAWVNQHGVRRHGDVRLSEFGRFTFRPAGSRESEHIDSAERQRIVDLQQSISEMVPGGIRFAQPEETRSDYEGAERETRVAGVPTLAELTVLRDFLARNPHGNFGGTEIWFARSGGSTPTTTWGEYWAPGPNGGRDGGPRLMILPRARMDLEGFRGFPGTLGHELGGHHLQGLCCGHSDYAWGDRRGASRFTPEVRQYIQQLGFAEGAREALIVDESGNFWRRNPNADNEGRDRAWLPARGRRPGGRESLSDQEMARIARVTPATLYSMRSPDESLAEGWAMFERPEVPDGQRTAHTFDRRHLAENSPEVYNVARNFDQRMINQHYKTQQDPSDPTRTVPGRIRNLDGRIIPWSREAEERILSRERQWLSHAGTSSRRDRAPVN